VTEIKLGNPPDGPGGAVAHLFAGQFKQKKESKTIAARKLSEHLAKKAGIVKEQPPKQQQIDSVKVQVTKAQEEPKQQQQSNSKQQKNEKTANGTITVPVETKVDEFTEFVNRYKSSKSN